MQMLVTHSEEGGTYEQRDETKHLSRRLETMPRATAGINGVTAGSAGETAGSAGAESLDETVHYLEIRRFPIAAGLDSAILAVDARKI
jgi:hypothetical protein